MTELGLAIVTKLTSDIRKKIPEILEQEYITLEVRKQLFSFFRYCDIPAEEEKRYREQINKMPIK